MLFAIALFAHADTIQPTDVSLVLAIDNWEGCLLKPSKPRRSKIGIHQARREAKLRESVLELLVRYFDSIEENARIDEQMIADFLIVPPGRLTQVVVVCTDSITLRTINQLQHALDKRYFTRIEETWLVGNAVDKTAEQSPLPLASFTRIMDLDALEAHCATFKPFQRFKSGKSPIARAIATNKSELIVACAGLLETIDRQLGALQGRPPNSPSSVKKQKEELDDLTYLREKVVELQRAVVSRRVPGKRIDAPVLSVRGAVNKYWQRHSQRTVGQGISLTLFSLSMSVCGLAGAGGPMTAVVAGAIAGGKPLVDALRSLGVKLPGRTTKKA